MQNFDRYVPARSPNPLSQAKDIQNPRPEPETCEEIGESVGMNRKQVQVSPSLSLSSPTLISVSFIVRNGSRCVFINCIRARSTDMGT